MITSINKLENLGIYDCIPPKRYQDFRRYNLIYGWNGSGKSTLSRLFACMGGQKTFDDFEKLKTSIICNDISYSEKEFPISGENILVFNEDFINDNINWNGTIKSILLLDEENIEDVKKYNKLKELLYGKDDDEGEIQKLSKRSIELEKDLSGIQKILTNIGKTVKNNYQILDTGDTYYLNYDKRKVSNLIENKDNPLSDADLLNAKELDLAIKQAKPIKKNKITVDIVLLNKSDIQNHVQKTKEVITRKVSAKVIEELKDEQRLSEWVELGINLHKDKRETCAFCGNVISSSRIDELEAHFSDALKKLDADIELLIEYWESVKCVDNNSIGDIGIYYEELVAEISECNAEYREKSQELNDEILDYIELLKKKKNNPFEIIEFNLNCENIYTYSSMINDILQKYKNVILKHNQKTDTFEESTNKVRQRIERHYVQEQIKGLSYRKKVDEYNKKKEDFEKDKTELKKKEDEYNSLENQLSNETLGAEEFNQKLERFLGYDEIKLKFDIDAKGYKIYRNLKEEAEHLSEGEKTAIAFIYFVTKIKEAGRRIEDCIIVIDDPISSFDSNKLFSSYAYTKSECDNAKQLFVLTHNYNYFSLVLGWFNKRHKKDPVTGKKTPDYSLYRVENRIVDGKRVAWLSDGGESLKQATEYDYVFFTVYSMKDNILSKKESIFCGNVCRKLVESFLSFKFPKQRGDLMALLNAALPEKENDIVRERIYKFINIYSHDKKINVFEELDAEILDANSQLIINDVLNMINNLDPNHYNAMIDKFEEELQCS
jgi:wobble nucleotide-excising tRNase